MTALSREHALLYLVEHLTNWPLSDTGSDPHPIAPHYGWAWGLKEPPHAGGAWVYELCPLDDRSARPIGVSAWLEAKSGAMTPQERTERNKYQREIAPGLWVDVYDVLLAFDVRNPALQHLIKKALCAGLRGHKTTETDLQDIIDSAMRAKELHRG